MKHSRSSGILLHPTSIPGPYGIGDLGDGAFHFVDFLANSSQHLWQILPLGPTGYGDSPYQCYSAFAGNIILISPQRLLEQGLIEEEALSKTPECPQQEKVDYNSALEFKMSLLQEAFENFSRKSYPELSNNFEAFSREEADWLEGYALFQAVRNIQGRKSWNQWETALAERDPKAIDQIKSVLSEKIEAQKFHQFLFFQQWFKLKTYCNQNKVKLIGDIPIFVAYDSADVWTNPDLFKLNSDGSPKVVAGVPPDYFSETGQLWGNPIYNWEVMQERNFDWWIKRVQATLKTVDILRIDHFRGFAASWEVPSGEPTAVNGEWVKTPGQELFDTLHQTLGELPIIAEDLGLITPDVEELRDRYGFPGMKVLQFGFSTDTTNIHLPHNYTSNCVVYTGTHDNNTTVGWFNENKTKNSLELDRERAYCLKYLNSNGNDIHWDFIRTVSASVANTAIIPLQDLLGLDATARMNFPSTTQGNWSWRYTNNALTDNLLSSLKEITTTYGRD